MRFREGVLFLLAVGLLGSTAAAAEDLEIVGAGATFPQPLYAKWFAEYRQSHPGVSLQYQPIGSGSGVKKLTNHAVFFAASDAPLTQAQMAEAGGGIFHFPTTIGAVVVIYNLPQAPAELKLSPAVLADVFLGKIAKWNDSRLQALNPSAQLPDLDIRPVYRSDGSGTTFIFTDYLSKVSRPFASQVGAGTSVKWPLGVGRGGSDPVASLVGESSGSIGYVELSYANEHRLRYAMLQNASGDFVAASLKSLEEAAAGETMPEDFRISITNAKAPRAYPIASFTWLVVDAASKDRARTKAMADFISWALTTGQKFCVPLGYAPLPESVVKAELSALKKLRGER